MEKGGFNNNNSGSTSVKDELFWIEYDGIDGTVSVSILETPKTLILQEIVDKSGQCSCNCGCNAVSETQKTLMLQPQSQLWIEI